MAFTPIPKGTENWDQPVNAAFQGQDARITENSERIDDVVTVNGQQWFEITRNRESISALEGRLAPGVHIPADWGQFWRPKRDASGSSASRVMFVGDSVTQGYYCSNFKTASWPGLIRQQLQTAYGDGGSGFFGTSRTRAVLAANATAAAAWEANGSLATTTGAWTSNILFGPGITHLRATAAASATFKVTGSNIRLWYITGGAPRAAWQYSIDGGAPVDVPAAVTATAIAQINLSGLTPTEHTVVVSWNGAAGDVLDFIGVAGENATGVIVDNMARSGTNSTQWGNNSQLTLQWNGGVGNPADLVVFSIGINDAALNSTTPDVYVAGLARYLQAVKQANNGATDIIIVWQHYGSTANTDLYLQYASRILGIADAYGAALINLWTKGRNSWSYWNSLGYWGDPANPGPAGTNSVHPSDAGHAYIASQVAPLILS